MDISKAIDKFQSTHPRGVRLICSWQSGQGTTGFNPRTHAGCDRKPQLYILPPEVFQSTHPRGVRLLLEVKDYGTQTFQSTHPRGVRPASIPYLT